MKIGQLAKSSGCSVQTIRYYEKEGLISAPSRSEGNFRLYDQQAEERLIFIKRCRNLDLSLDEVKQLLTLSLEPDTACDEVNQIVDKHIQLVEARISDLQNLHGQLRRLREDCTKSLTVNQCGIIKTLKAQGVDD